MTRSSKYPEQQATINYVISNEERSLDDPLSVTILANLSLQRFFPVEFMPASLEHKATQAEISRCASK